MAAVGGSMGDGERDGRDPDRRRDRSFQFARRRQALIHTIPIRRRLGQEIISSSIVSAVDADTGEPLDPGSFGIYSSDTGTATGSQPPASPGIGPFSSPVATQGTGLGPSPFVTPSWLQNFINNNLPNALPNLLLIGLAALAFIYLAERRK